MQHSRGPVPDHTGYHPAEQSVPQRGLRDRLPGDGELAGGFRGDVRITNTGTAPLTGWSLAWQFTGGQRITQLWNGTVRQDGAAVTVTNAAWNGALAAGGSASFGFLGSWTGSNPAPAAFTLDGTACTTS